MEFPCMTTQTTHARGRWAGLGLLVLTTILWGSTFPIVREVVTVMPPLRFLAWRFGLAAVLLAPLLRGPWRALLPGFALGLINAAGFLLQTMALRRIGADQVAFLTGLSVILVPVLEALWLRRVPGRLAVWALACGAAGLVLVTTGGSLAHLGASAGDLLGILCAVAFALQVLGTSRLARRTGSLHLSAQEIVAGAVVFVAIVGLNHPEDLAIPPVRWWWAVGFAALPATVLTFFLQTAGQARVSATVAALTFNLEPVFAALWAYILMGQTLSGTALAGALLVLAGMVLAALPGAEPSRKDAATWKAARVS